MTEDVKGLGGPPEPTCRWEGSVARGGTWLASGVHPRICNDKKEENQKVLRVQQRCMLVFVLYENKNNNSKIAQYCWKCLFFDKRLIF